MLLQHSSHLLLSDSYNTNTKVKVVSPCEVWPISHSGPKNLSRTGGPEHYLVYGRPNHIPNLVGKTDHNVGGLACILGLTNSHNQSP